jgi:outer membrane protein TolC
MEVFDRSVDDLIEEAQRRRPDLAAVRAFLRRKEADLRQAESARWPTLSSVLSIGTITDGTIPPGNDPNYLAGLQIQIPVFQGGALDNAVRGARQDVEAARAALQLQSDVVVSDVWNTYINVRTASQQIISSQALVRSAELAYEAALARYRAGATNIVELVTVQSTLAGARSQQVQARTNLYTSYAELLRAVGMVPPGAMPAAGSSPLSREEQGRK